MTSGRVGSISGAAAFELAPGVDTVVVTVDTLPSSAAEGVVEVVVDMLRSERGGGGRRGEKRGGLEGSSLITE
jgi:hypothetical protein